MQTIQKGGDKDKYRSLFSDHTCSVQPPPTFLPPTFVSGRTASRQEITSQTLSVLFFLKGKRGVVSSPLTEEADLQPGKCQTQHFGETAKLRSAA